MATRKQILDALLARLSTAGDFKTVSRRNRNPESLKPEMTPALFLVKHSESYRSPSPSQPTIRTLFVKIIIYSDVGADQNAVPGDVTDAIRDQVEALLTPDSPLTNKFTLGGLVDSVTEDGSSPDSPGDVTGKSLAVIPLRIVLP